MYHIYDFLEAPAEITKTESPLILAKSEGFSCFALKLGFCNLRLKYSYFKNHCNFKCFRIPVRWAIATP